MTRIQTRATTTKDTPASGDMIDREIAYSFQSGKLFVKNPVNGAIEVIGGKAIVDQVTSPAVSSVAGKTGAVVLTTSDIQGYVAPQPPLITSVAGRTGDISLSTADISGYVAPPVTSVAGKTGAVVLSTGDINGYVAPPVTSVAGKTGTVTLTTADINGYVAPPVTSINGRTGSIVLTTADVGGLGNIATHSTSEFATAAQGTKADGAVQSSSLGVASGVATLAADGKLSPNQVPDIAISQLLGTVNSQAAMLALTGQLGDWVIRSDLGNTWVISGTPTTSISSWTQLSYPAAAVASVAGKTGVVTLTTSDIVGYVAPPVNSVAGKTGTVTLTTADISGYVAPPVTAVAGRTGSIVLTTADIGGYTAPTVTSVAGKQGAVTLTTADIGGLGTVATHAVTEFVKTINGGLPDASGNINIATATSPVTSVAGKTGAVVITTSDVVGYTPPPVTKVAGKTGDVVITTADVQGYVAPTVSSVAGKTGDVLLSTSDISGYVAPPVTSVAGKTGAVTLAPADIVGLGNIATHSVSEFATAAQGALATTAIQGSAKGAANGVASLDSTGKVPAAQMPDAALVQYLGTTANQAAMLALTGQQGDWTNRTDTGTTWVITGSTPSSIASWTQLNYPTAAVSSVAGKTGAVTLTTADIGGYVAPPVTSVAGKTGAVVLSTADISGYTAPTVTSVAGKQGAVVLTTADIGGYVAPTVASVAGKTGTVTLTSSDLTDSGAAGRSLIQAATTAAVYTTLGLGNIVTHAVSEFASAAQGTLASTALQQAAADLRYIRSVNGVFPDASGNVTVSGGSGGLLADGGVF